MTKFYSILIISLFQLALIYSVHFVFSLKYPVCFQQILWLFHEALIVNYENPLLKEIIIINGSYQKLKDFYPKMIEYN